MSATETLLVCETLTAEHRYTETLLEQLENSINQLAAQTTEAHYQAFKNVLQHLHHDMNTHFACEEKALFPVLSKYHTMVLMEAEHEMLLEQRTQLEACKMTDMQTIQTLGMQFIEDLRNHIAREDAGIFPEAEAELLLREKQLVVTHMQEIRDKAANGETPSLERPERFFEVLPSVELSADEAKAVNIQLLGKNEALQIKKLTLHAGAEIKEHWSPDGVWLYLLQGQAEIITANQSANIQAGESILLTPRLKHKLKALDACVFIAVFSEHN